MSLNSAWRQRQSRLFTGRRIAEGPFAHTSWRVTVLPFGLDVQEEDLLRLVTAFEDLGVREVAVCGLRDEFGSSQPESVTPLARFEPEPLFVDTVLGAIETGVFTETERWALACSPDGFSLFAAESPEYEVVTSKLGGVTALSARVRHMLAEGEFGSFDTARSLILGALDNSS